MAAVQSTMLPLGTQAPDFALPDPDGNTVKLDDVKGEKGTLVTFICNHCPFVKHVAEELARVGLDVQSKGIGVVAIQSNDVANYPQDAPDKMKEMKQQHGWSFPYLHDESQEVAKAYTAACTPDFFLFDGDLKLFYRGQLDDSRPDSGIPVTGQDLRGAVEALIAGQNPPEPQKPSMGCNIKWKQGGEPGYFRA